MDVSAVFWVATTVMAILATGFIAAPLIRHQRRTSFAAVAAMLPLFSAGLYLTIGSPQAAGVSAPTTASTVPPHQPQASNKRSAGSIANLVDGLAARLEQNPDDGKSWMLLARSYEHLGQLDDAKKAYERAASLGEYDDKLAALTGQPADNDAVVEIRGNLQLSERSRSIVKPTDTVFVFAKALDGTSMPLAAIQEPVSSLPLEFVLNDSQAMSADAKLSDHEQVVVTARISRSGTATKALKGLEAKSPVIVVAEKRYLNLIIQ